MKHTDDSQPDVASLSVQTTRVIETWHPLVEGPPAWASSWGEDEEFGPFVEIKVGKAKQRLRWIPKGRFLMGSPKEEAGRDDDEGPKHEVMISRGFWMFDTPCTQAFYQAVVGGNPSSFRSPDRPVESVSWKDAQQFLDQVRRLVPGIDIALPTEAEWEYALGFRCRVREFKSGEKLSNSVSAEDS